MSPHPYANVSSPHGPNSPAQHHQSMASPQPSSAPSPASSTQGWVAPGPGGPPTAMSQQQQGITNRMSQQQQKSNPLLNAQLSGAGFAQQTPPAQQGPSVRLTPRHPLPMPHQANMRPVMANPGARNSPTPQYHPQGSPGVYHQPGAPQPGGPQSRLIQLIPNPQQQPLIQGPQQRPGPMAGRTIAPRFANASNDGGMQQQQFSNYGPGNSGTPIQLEARSSPNLFMSYDSRTISSSSGVSSEAVKNNIRAMVAGRQLAQQQLLHSQMSPMQSSAPSSSSQLDPDDLEALGLSLELSEATGLGLSSDGGDDHSGPDSFSSMLANLTDITSSSASSPIMVTSAPATSSAGQHMMRSHSINSPRMVSFNVCVWVPGD